MAPLDTQEFSPSEKDRKLGQKALERGWITPEQLAEAQADQDQGARRGKVRPLGNILASKGFLSDERLVALLEEVTASSAAPPAGKIESFPISFGKYSLQREVGRGGMGVVYEALDTVLHRKVALKLVLSDPEGDADRVRQEVERFMREARLSANLSKQPNIVGVYDAGQVDGKCYLAMEFIEGQSMSKWRKSGSARLRDQVAVLRDVARAVHHAHQHGIIHRDLKPDNILMDARLQPHVTDFGLAKSISPDVGASLTAQGVVMGTPVYMSPEQAQGLPTVDARTDIYSLGVMLYEVLAGRPPFTADSPLGIIMKAVNDPVTPPSKVAPAAGPDPVPTPSAMEAGGKSPAVDRRLEEICLRALAKEPGKRQETAELLAADLDRWLGSVPVVAGLAATPLAPPPPPPASGLPPAQSRPRRRGVAVWAALFLLAGGGASYVTWGMSAPERRLGLARILGWAGRDQEALALYEAVLKEDPQNAAATRGREALRGKGVAAGGDSEAEKARPTAKPTPEPVPERVPERVPEKEPTVPPAPKPPKEGPPAKPAATVAAEHRGPVDKIWSGAVATLPPEEKLAAVLQKLKELNPDFGAKARHRLDGGKLAELTLLSSAISDLSPLHVLGELKSLDVLPEAEPGTTKIIRGRIVDLSPLRGLGLHRLRISNCPLRDLSPLRGMPLTLLRCDDTEVSDLGPLKGMALTYLELINCPVVDLGPLQGMPIDFLALGGTAVTDLAPLKDMPLTRVFLLKLKVTDYSPLKNCPLKAIRFPYVAERDAALLGSIKTLEEINDLPAAEFMMKFGHPWHPVFDGKSTEGLTLSPKGGWTLDKGSLVSTGADCFLVTREEFDNGEFRIRYRAEGVAFLSVQVRHSAEKGYAVVPDQGSPAQPRGKVHEVIFSCQEDQVSAILDGQPAILKYKNGPRKGPIQLHVLGGHLSLLSIDHR